MEQHAPATLLEPAVVPAVADLSVVIVSWNTRELLLRCLAALDAAAGGLRVDSIVVDNGSTDGTPEAVQACFTEV